MTQLGVQVERLASSWTVQSQPWVILAAASSAPRLLLTSLHIRATLLLTSLHIRATLPLTSLHIRATLLLLDTKTGCRLAPVPLDPAYWKTPVNPELLHWGDGELKMELTRRAGPRIHTLDGYAFGMYSLKVKADATPGAVTAFYVSGRPGWCSLVLVCLLEGWLGGGWLWAPLLWCAHHSTAGLAQEARMMFSSWQPM
jgi:hypothetical protein